ncbi:hypothetical protein F4780DRAFT_281292 [Xylariomycetidae sp. FL0641]|nr:hypothetical protein F4780DRAFT_281292 [Xylariomycetidae sp. FL0641]
MTRLSVLSIVVLTCHCIAFQLQGLSCETVASSYRNCSAAAPGVIRMLPTPLGQLRYLETACNWDETRAGVLVLGVSKVPRYLGRYLKFAVHGSIGDSVMLAV